MLHWAWADGEPLGPYCRRQVDPRLRPSERLAKDRFAADSPLEEGVYCELVSESEISEVSISVGFWAILVSVIGCFSVRNADKRYLFSQQPDPSSRR
jgi:hypothetical protein